MSALGRIHRGKVTRLWRARCVRCDYSPAVASLEIGVAPERRIAAAADALRTHLRTEHPDLLERLDHGDAQVCGDVLPDHTFRPCTLPPDAHEVHDNGDGITWTRTRVPTPTDNA